MLVQAMADRGDSGGHWVVGSRLEELIQKRPSKIFLLYKQRQHMYFVGEKEKLHFFQHVLIFSTKTQH